jgi:hypothetical protein
MVDTLRLVPKAEVERDEAVQSVITQLEGLLERAKAGEIEGFACAILFSNGSCDTGFSETTSYHRLMGAIAHLQVEYFMAGR